MVTVMSVPRAATDMERQLEAAQKAFVRGLQADAERKAALQQLYDDGMTQKELAARMTRASLAVGGPEVTANMVYKLLKRMRRHRYADDEIEEGHGDEEEWAGQLP